jgi:hypothetical protein
MLDDDLPTWRACRRCSKAAGASPNPNEWSMTGRTRWPAKACMTSSSIVSGPT